MEGYLKQAKKFLTEADRKYLYNSIHLIAFELGLRVFADYLVGDAYFKTSYGPQNLNGAHLQVKLCEGIEVREYGGRRVLDGNYLGRYFQKCLGACPRDNC